MSGWSLASWPRLAARVRRGVALEPAGVVAASPLPVTAPVRSTPPQALSSRITTTITRKPTPPPALVPPGIGMRIPPPPRPPPPPPTAAAVAHAAGVQPSLGVEPHRRLLAQGSGGSGGAGAGRPRLTSLMISAQQLEVRAGARLLMHDVSFRVGPGRQGGAGRAQRCRQDHPHPDPRRRGPARVGSGDRDRLGRLPPAGPADRRPRRTRARADPVRARPGRRRTPAPGGRGGDGQRRRRPSASGR